MKASPTVIYDIGMSGIVTRPMGRPELRRYLNARYLYGCERGEGRGNAYPQLICRSQFYWVAANGDEPGEMLIL